MQLRRIARDSNRELRLALNSSAFGPGDYLLKIDGYNWRGQTEDGRLGTHRACSDAARLIRLAASRPADDSRPSASRACR